jgi:hypothetical protein
MDIEEKAELLFLSAELKPFVLFYRIGPRMSDFYFFLAAILCLKDLAEGKVNSVFLPI